MSRMKVLLLQDLTTLGRAGEVYSVAGGYARNFLMPQGIAVPATKGVMKQAEDIRESGLRRRAKEKAGAEAQATVISSKKLLFEVKAGSTGRMYGSITTADLGDRLAEKVDFEIDRRKILLDHPIRDLGLYNVRMRLMADVIATFSVGVVLEGEGWAKAEAYAKATADAAKAAEAVKERVDEAVETA